jgi:hypothetical protein
LYGFGGNTYYYDPAVVAFDSNGNIYGTTNVGPGSLVGSIFRLTAPDRRGSDWRFRQLYGFAGGSDGKFPFAALAFNRSGNAYGATQEGGGKGTCEGYCGTVFEIQP